MTASLPSLPSGPVSPFAMDSLLGALHFLGPFVLGYALVLWWRWRRNPSCSRFHALQATHDMVGLFTHEWQKSGTMRVPAITTVSFYDGERPDDLGERLGAVVRANPWLQGQLVTNPKGRPVLAVPKTEHLRPDESVARSLRHVTDPALHADMPYGALRKRTAEFSAKTGAECLDQPDQTLFRVAVVAVEEQRFALVVSMSHMLGDAHTFYQVCSMLDRQRQPFAMTAARPPDFERGVRRMLGEAVAEFLASTLLLVAFSVSLNFQPRHSPVVHLVNPKGIQQLKESHAHKNKKKAKGRGVPYVSTNDILVSWFCALCGASINYMMVNFRNHIPGATDAHACNLVGTVVYAARYRPGTDTSFCSISLQALHPRGWGEEGGSAHQGQTGKSTYGGRPGQRVEEQGTWAAQKHSEAGYGRPVDRGVWTAKTVKRPRQQPAHPQYANYWAPLTRKRHTMPHSAQPRHTNYWAPRTRKRHQQEHRPQRPTERSDPTQHAKGRTGDCPGPRKGATT